MIFRNHNHLDYHQITRFN